MKIVNFLLVVFIYLSSSVLIADEKYRGLIVAHIVEPNGHVYRGYDGFTNDGEFEQKKIIYFSQERGQVISLNGNNVVFDSSTTNKYHMKLQILDRKGEKYKAELSFFINAMEYQESSQDYALVSKLLKKTEIEGVLNSENKFTFVDENKPNLKLSIKYRSNFQQARDLESVKK